MDCQAVIHCKQSLDLVDGCWIPGCSWTPRVWSIQTGTVRIVIKSANPAAHSLLRQSIWAVDTPQLLPNVDWSYPLVLQKSDDHALVCLPLLSTFEHDVQCLLLALNCPVKQSLSPLFAHQSQLSVQSVPFCARDTATDRAQIGNSRPLCKARIAVTSKPGSSHCTLV